MKVCHHIENFELKNCAVKSDLKGSGRKLTIWNGGNKTWVIHTDDPEGSFMKRIFEPTEKFTPTEKLEPS
jgi:hypothetical protein